MNKQVTFRYEILKRNKNLWGIDKIEVETDDFIIHEPVIFNKRSKTYRIDKIIGVDDIVIYEERILVPDFKIHLRSGEIIYELVKALPYNSNQCLQDIMFVKYRYGVHFNVVIDVRQQPRLENE